LRSVQLSNFDTDVLCLNENEFCELQQTPGSESSEHSV